MSDYSQVPLNEGLLCKQVVYCLSRQKTLSLGKANQMQGILCHLFFFSQGHAFVCAFERQRARKNERLKEINHPDVYFGRFGSLSGPRHKIVIKVINLQRSNRGLCSGVICMWH